MEVERNDFVWLTVAQYLFQKMWQNLECRYLLQINLQCVVNGR